MVVRREARASWAAPATRSIRPSIGARLIGDPLPVEVDGRVGGGVFSVDGSWTIGVAVGAGVGAGVAVGAGVGVAVGAGVGVGMNPPQQDTGGGVGLGVGVGPAT